jgi:hypothetical protein
MPGYNLLQIVAVGPEERFLYGNPKFSFFKSVYRKHTNFASTYNYIVFDNPSRCNFGGLITMRIPRSGDLLGGLYLRVKLSNLVRINPFYSYTTPYGSMAEQANYSPQFTSYVNGIGAFMIEYADFKIGEQLIERLDGDMIFINNEFKSDLQQKISYNSLIRYFPNNFTIGVSNINDVEIILQLPFFFTNDPSLYLPLIALANTECQINIKIKPLDKCIITMYNNFLSLPSGTIGIDGWQLSGGSIIPYGNTYNLGEHLVEPIVGYFKECEMIALYYFLGDEERRIFTANPLQYIISLNRTDLRNFLITNSIKKDIGLAFEINPRFPVKCIWWLLQRQDVYNINQYDNYSYENPLENSGIYYPSPFANIINNGKIILDNYDIVDRVSCLVYSKLEQMINFKTSTDILVYSYSFGLFPNEINPSGTFNFSRMRNKVLELYFNDPNLWQKQPLLLRTYYRYYNLLTIRDGLAGVSFI